MSKCDHPLVRAAQKYLYGLGGLGDVRDGAVLAHDDAAVLYELELAWSAHTVHEAAAQHEPSAHHKAGSSSGSASSARRGLTRSPNIM